MTVPPRSAPSLDDPATAWRWLLVLAGGLALARIAALFATPLQFYPDEAQYWLWSRELHWGYVSKPPLIAWLIWATTRLGDSEAWARLSAPLLHAAAMLALYRTGLRLYGPRAGLLAAVLYGLMPAVQVSALFIATDAPLMCFLALSLWAYVALVQTSDAGRRRLVALGFGAAMGLAFLAKFAAVYFLLSIVLHAAIDRDARRAWGRGAWALALLALALSFGPNLLWQATNGFATVAHTTEVNAHWSASRLFNLGPLVEFVLGQFGVLGPVPFAVLVGGAVLLALRRALTAQDRLLLCFSLPPLVIVTVQAFVSRAHSHWAAAGYLAGVVLAAGWLLRWRAKGWIVGTLALQGAVAALLLVVVAAPQIVDASGNGRRLGRIRAWDGTADIVTAAARSAQAHGGLTAVVVEDRYLFNELAYYGRDYFGSPGAAPLRMRPPQTRALNDAELSAPLRPHEAARVLIAETAGKPEQPLLPSDFALVTRLGRWSLWLDSNHTRDLELMIAGQYRRQEPGAPTSRPTAP